MRITLFGNTNNYPYRLALALRELHHNVFLIVTDTYHLHRPESVDPELAHNYPDWILDFSHLTQDDFVGPSARILPLIETLEISAGLILNHIGPSLLGYVDKPAIALLTGSDLDYFADFASIAVRTETWSDNYRQTRAAALHNELWTDFIARQRDGILRAEAVSFFPPGVQPASDALLSEIGVSDAKRFFLYMTGEGAGDYTAPPTRPKPRVFCSARLTWGKPIAFGTSAIDYKGTDRLLQGLLSFNETTGLKLDVRLVKKGAHVEQTEMLARELGVAEQITWLEEMPHHEFRKELSDADICIDQLDASLVGMAGLDAMGMGRPLIANGRPEIFEPSLREHFPICQAHSASEVCAQLQRLVADPEQRIAIGKRSQQFVRQHWSPLAAAQRCVSILAGQDPEP